MYRRHVANLCVHTEPLDVPSVLNTDYVARPLQWNVDIDASPLRLKYCPLVHNSFNIHVHEYFKYIIIITTPTNHQSSKFISTSLSWSQDSSVGTAAGCGLDGFDSRQR
jgi:hypothetical protein